jgi:hypothetical protein
MFYDFKKMYKNFILQPLFKSAQQFYKKSEGSGSVLVSCDYWIREARKQ